MVFVSNFPASVGSGENHYSFKKYRRFLPEQLYANQPETIRINEPCKGCGVFGMWEGVDNSCTNSCNTRNTFERVYEHICDLYGKISFYGNGMICGHFFN